MSFDIRNVSVWMNSVFQSMPHPYFFTNCVKQHLKVNHPHMPFSQREAWQKVYAEKLQKGEILRINNLTFKWTGH